MPRLLRPALVLLALCSSSLVAVEPLFETVCLFPVTPDSKPNYSIPGILLAPNGDLLVIA